jgi:N-acylneuraminate cytidylyltransferase
MKNLCLIPARAGSKGVPGKNTKPLNGTPLLEYTFQSALRANSFDRIIISTDDPQAAQTAYDYNVDVPFLRPGYLAKDNTPTFDVVHHAVKFFEQIGEHYDLVCLLQPTCPFRNEGFIDQCIEHLLESGADSLCSVTKIPHQYNPHWAFEPDEKGYLKIATGEATLITSRQKLPDAFVRDGSVYIFKTDVILNQKSLYGNNITYLESDNQWHVNIDTKDDWYKAEMIANVLCSVN